MNTSSAARNGRQQRNDISLGHLGIKTIQVASVFIVHIDVYETVQLALAGHELLLHSGVLVVQLLYEIRDRPWFQVNDRLPRSEFAEDRWDPNFDWQLASLD
jgi:hypothetical protein